MQVKKNGIIALLIRLNTSGQCKSLRKKLLDFTVFAAILIVRGLLIPLGIVAHARASDLFLHNDNEPSFMYNTIIVKDI